MKRLFIALAFVMLALPARAETVFFRGLFGLVFSTGIIDMARISGEPHHCWCAAAFVEADILRRWRAGDVDGPVNIVGHSLGANAAMHLAIRLDRAGVPVGRVFLLDPTVTGDLAGFAATDFMSRDWRARKVAGAKIIRRPDLAHVPLARDGQVQLAILAAIGAPPTRAP